MDEQIPVTFPSGTGNAELQAVWHPPTTRATNGAVIVLPGGGYTKDHWLNVDLCVGAAALGLTAVRFDYTADISDNFVRSVVELVPVLNFLKSFGKEIKPTRYYLLGKSMPAAVALGLADADYLMSSFFSPGKLNGIAVLGLPLFNNNGQSLPITRLFGFHCPLLVVQGDYDPYGNPQEIDTFLKKLPIPHQIEIIKEAGHSYEPVPPLTNTEKQAEAQRQNIARVVQITLDWLEKQESIREELRK